MHYIYKITNRLDGKVYIGQTVNTDNRWKAHKSYAKNKTKCKQVIHQAIAKYGIENFEFEVLACSLDKDSANDAEVQIIKQYNSRDKKNGYNIAVGGGFSMLGLKHSDETKARIGAASRGIKPSNEARKKRSESMRAVVGGKQPSWLVGIKKSKEERERLAVRMSGDNNPNAKINYEIANRIRIEYSKGKTQQELAVEFGVGRSTITRVVLNKIWIDESWKPIKRQKVRNEQGRYKKVV